MIKPILGVDVETVGLYGELLGFCLYNDSTQLTFSKEQAEESRPLIQDLFDNHTLVAHQAKYEARILRREGFRYEIGHDTKLMAYLLNPLAPTSLDEVAHRYLKRRKNTISQDKKNLSWNQETIDYCMVDTELTYRLATVLLNELVQVENQHLWYIKYERPYIDVIMEMEGTGLVIDAQATKQAAHLFTERLSAALVDVQAQAPLVRGPEKIYARKTEEGCGYYARDGMVTYDHCSLEPFNPASSHHIVEVLKGYGWVPKKFTEKGFPATDADTLKELDYPIIKPILVYKDYQKAVGTYLNAFLEHSKPLSEQYSVLFGTFSQTGTITGRLSSSSP
jgi:DNA polymerase-1